MNNLKKLNRFAELGIALSVAPSEWQAYYHAKLEQQIAIEAEQIEVDMLGVKVKEMQLIKEFPDRIQHG